MDEKEFNDKTDRVEIFSKAVRAGKRTYFFDVKATKESELYLSITESKRRFNNDTGKFFYEKHKLFLYSEDFERFQEGLVDTMRFIETGEKPLPDPDEFENDFDNTSEPKSEFTERKSVPDDLKSEFTDIEFEDLMGSDFKE